MQFRQVNLLLKEQRYMVEHKLQNNPVYREIVCRTFREIISSKNLQ